jgi:hypothetical protein
MSWEIIFRALNQSSKCGSHAIAHDVFVLFLWWCKTECLGTLAANGPIVLAPDDGWENGAIAEWQIDAETEILGEKPASDHSVYQKSQRNCPGIELVSCYGNTLEMNYIYRPTHRTPSVPFQELKQQYLKINTHRYLQSRTATRGDFPCHSECAFVTWCVGRAATINVLLYNNTI